MQPRRSPSRVNVTNAPAGRRSVSSKSSAFQSGERPSSTAAIDCRAMRRSVLRCSSLSSNIVHGPRAADQHQIADVHDQCRSLAEDDDGVATEDAVDGHEDAAGHRKIPESDRHMADPAALGCDPLHEEARRDERLRDEAERGQQVPVPGAGIVRVHEFSRVYPAGREAILRIHSSSFTRYVNTRFDIHRTATQSANPRNARFIAPYFDTPN